VNGFDFDDEAGIEAIIRSREAGFRFTHMCSADEVVPYTENDVMWVPSMSSWSGRWTKPTLPVPHQ
jgi:hypothetical protein